MRIVQDGIVEFTKTEARALLEFSHKDRPHLGMIRVVTSGVFCLAMATCGNTFAQLSCRRQEGFSANFGVSREHINRCLRLAGARELIRVSQSDTEIRGIAKKGYPLLVSLRNLPAVPDDLAAQFPSETARKLVRDTKKQRGIRELCFQPQLMARLELIRSAVASEPGKIPAMKLSIQGAKLDPILARCGDWTALVMPMRDPDE